MIEVNCRCNKATINLYELFMFLPIRRRRVLFRFISSFFVLRMILLCIVFACSNIVFVHFFFVFSTSPLQSSHQIRHLIPFELACVNDNIFFFLIIRILFKNAKTTMILINIFYRIQCGN